MTNHKQPSNKKNKQNKKGGGKQPLRVPYTQREIELATSTGENEVVKAVKAGRPVPVAILDSLPNKHRETGNLLKRKAAQARTAHNRS